MGRRGEEVLPALAAGKVEACCLCGIGHNCRRSVLLPTWLFEGGELAFL